MAITLDGTNGINSSGVIVAPDGSASAPAITNDGDTNTGIFFPAADTIAFAEGGAEAMRIDSSGNVGIGTTSPSTRMQLGDGSSGQLKFRIHRGSGTDYTDYFNETGSTIVDTVGGGNFILKFSGTERMRIDSSGNLLVGTTTASNKFVVSGNTGGTAVAQIINSTSSGNVISLASTLQSNGNNTSSAHFQGSTAGVGNWYLFGNGTTSYSSDQRLKKNIETTRDGYLEDLCQLRVVKYNWKNDEEGKPKELGLIAQEVEQVFPSLVQDDLNPISQDDPTLYKQLKQSVLPFMLLKAIQELSAKNDELEARIAALEGAQA